MAFTSSASLPIETMLHDPWRILWKIYSSARCSKRKWRNGSTHRSSRKKISASRKTLGGWPARSSCPISSFSAISQIRKDRRVLNSVETRVLIKRLCIPLTSSTDPRQSFAHNVGIGFTAVTFSQWFETLGSAALRHVDMFHRLADIAWQEYLAVRLRTALHASHIGLAIEQRWVSKHGQPLLSFGHDLEANYLQ